MSFTFTTLDDGHIILFVPGDDFNIKTELAPYVRGLLELTDSGPDRIVAVSDLRSVRLDFEDILSGGSIVRSGDGKAFVSHPKLIKSMVVFNSRVMEMTVKGLSSATFGSLDIPLFQSVEEALNAARSLLYGQAKAN